MRIPEHFRPVSLSDLNKAWNRVWREIEWHGLAGPKLETCQVRLGLIDQAYGYQWFGDRSDDRVCGDIILPSVSLSQWHNYFLGKKKESVLDILRHEYGHAYADANPRRIETKRFEKAFGRPHDFSPDDDGGYDPELHVTPYASTCGAEDFAEVFWKFLKHKGRLPRHHHTRPIIRKWEFIDSLCRY